MSPTGRSRRSLVPTMLLILPLSGCPAALTPEGAPISPGITCTPTTAGIVSDVEVQAEGTLYTLEDGSEILVPVNTRRFGAEPNRGDLLMFGESEECGVFRARAAPTELAEFGTCLAIYEAAIDDTDFVLFQEGLRVPKAEGFQSLPRYVSGVACLNESGEIVHYSD